MSAVSGQRGAQAVSALARLEDLVGARTAAAVTDLVAEQVTAEVAAMRSELVAMLAEVEAKSNPEWLSVPRAAEYLDCSERAIYARIARGVIPASKVGGRLFVSRFDLNLLLESRKRRRR